MKYKLSEFGTIFSKSKLNNGVNVFSFYRPGMPICVRAVFFAGARFDTIPGISHFLEHILVAGTEKFLSKDKLAEPLEKVGGSFSASTSLNCIRFNINVPQKEDLNTGLEILEEMLFKSLFDEKIIENERGSIISEIGEAEEDPYYELDNIYYSIVFKKTPLENKIIGNKDLVNKIKKQDLLNFKNDFLRTGRMCILISGGITIRECLPLLNKHFAEFKKERYFDMPEIATINRENFVQYKPFKNNKQVYAKLGFRTIGINENDKEMASLDIIAGVLGKGRASRLIKELRYKKGLVYGISAGQNNYPDAGHFSISTSFEHSKLKDVIEIIIDELKNIGENGINKEELEFIKSAINKSAFNNMQTSRSWINVHEDEMIFNPNLSRTLEYYMNEIDSLTLEEVNATAKKYLHKDNFYIALCGTDKNPNIKWE